TDVILNDNAAHYQQLNLEPNGAGGGVYNTGRLSATGLTLNFATANDGGAIVNLGTLDLTDGLIADASSLRCTGLYNGGGASATLTRVTIARNLAFIDELSGNGGGYGSALCNDGRARLEATSVISNYARVFAAGIWNNGNLELENTTIANNTLDAGFGGDGIAISTSGAVTADNVSIAGNVAEFTSTLPIHALIATGAGRFVLKNTLIAETPAEQNCTGTVISLGHNLSDDSSCPLSATGDLTNTPALLLPLGDYGGSTFTRPPSKNSPAIDKGTNTDCPASDQRGYARPADGDLNGNASCDIGAVEITPQHVFLPLIKR
ncbi:MAG TPA: choice-of-anchor Q domain-containing protein, partial [Anaerolineae bacterium]|nr:choice-of-anchor Q domain-containing protein [Anaerolineae bacterium]